MTSAVPASTSAALSDPSRSVPASTTPLYRTRCSGAGDRQLHRLAVQFERCARRRLRQLGREAERPLGREQLGQQPLEMRVKPCGRLRPETDGKPDAVADLESRLAAKRLEPMRDFPRQALRLKLVVDGRVERDEEVALLRDLVARL